MAVRAARTLAASMNEILSAWMFRFLSGEADRGDPFNEMVVHMYQCGAPPVKEFFPGGRPEAPFRILWARE